MDNRSRNVTRRARGRPKLYDRRTTIGLCEDDIAAVEALRQPGESWETAARRLLRRGIELTHAGPASSTAGPACRGYEIERCR